MNCRDVEAHRRHLEQLRHRDLRIGRQDGQAVGVGDVEDVVGGVEMRAARHLPQDDGRIAGDVLPQWRVRICAETDRLPTARAPTTTVTVLPL